MRTRTIQKPEQIQLSLELNKTGHNASEGLPQPLLICPKQCPSYEGCSAPICPLDPQSLELGIWLPDEPICRSKKYGTAKWIKRQRKIAEKAKNRDFFFTFKDFNVARIRNPRGHDPDKTSVAV